MTPRTSDDLDLDSPPAFSEQDSDSPAGRQSALSGRLVLLLLAALGPVAVWWIRPPAAQPADAPLEEFSALRAAQALEWIAPAPRPVGSEQHAAVRARLIEELEKLGLEVSLQEGTGSSWSDQSEIPLINVLARLRGQAGAKAKPEPAASVLLVAHYDSVAAAPGAGDDGSGVAAILETLRALSSGPPRTNDLLVLISDGEESGLLGAQLFVDEQHPWLKEVGAVFNFEGRGAGGPSILFQVGPNSSGLVELYRRSVAHPFGTSLAPAIFKKMPNDTDFTVFMGAGKPGLNFAFVGGGAAYHRPGDHIAALDLGSLQQHGEAMLSLVRALGDQLPGELDAPLEQEFLFLSGLRLVYPQALTAPLSIALAVACLAFLILRGAGKGSASRAGIFGTLLGAVAALGIVALAGAAVFYGAGAVYMAAERGADLLGLRPQGEAGSNLAAGEWLAGGAWLMGLGCVLLFVGVLGRGEGRDKARRRLDALGAGALFWIALGAAALALFVPGAGHLGLLTLAGTAICLWLTGPRRLPEDEGEGLADLSTDRSPGRFTAPMAFLAWAPAGVALLPLIALLVQLGSIEPFQERFLAAGASGLALLSAMPLLAVVGARREKLGVLFVLAGTLVFFFYSFSDMAVRIP